MLHLCQRENLKRLLSKTYHCVSIGGIQIKHNRVNSKSLVDLGNVVVQREDWWLQTVPIHGDGTCKQGWRRQLTIAGLHLELKKNNKFLNIYRTHIKQGHFYSYILDLFLYHVKLYEVK